MYDLVLPKYCWLGSKKAIFTQSIVSAFLPIHQWYIISHIHCSFMIAFNADILHSMLRYRIQCWYVSFNACLLHSNLVYCIQWLYVTFNAHISHTYTAFSAYVTNWMLMWYSMLVYYCIQWYIAFNDTMLHLMLIPSIQCSLFAFNGHILHSMLIHCIQCSFTAFNANEHTKHFHCAFIMSCSLVIIKLWLYANE